MPEDMENDDDDDDDEDDYDDDDEYNVIAYDGAVNDNDDFDLDASETIGAVPLKRSFTRPLTRPLIPTT